MYCKKCNSLLNEDNICPICDGGTAPQETNELSQAIEALKNGNLEAFNVFYNYTNKYVYSRAKTLSHDEQTANDVMQEVYISAYKNINSLKSNDSVFAWLRTITFNASNRIMKKYKNETVLSEENEKMLESLPDENEQIEEDYMNKQDIEIIHTCINRLSNEHRAVLLAYYYDNLKVEEIAEQLQISSGTVKSRLHTARKNLKEYIEEEEKKNGYKLHSFSGLSLALALRKLLQENMNNPTINTEALCRSICEKINIPANNSVITSAAKPKTKFIEGISRTSKNNIIQKIAEIGIKKVVLSTVAAITAAGVISGAVAVVISKSNNDSLTNYISTYSTVVETSSEEIISSEDVSSVEEVVSSEQQHESSPSSEKEETTPDHSNIETPSSNNPSDNLPKLELYTVTKYHGETGFFHTINYNIDTAYELQLAVDYGLTSNVNDVCAYPSEYWDIDTGNQIRFISTNYKPELKSTIESIGKNITPVHILDPNKILEKNKLQFVSVDNSNNINPKYGTVLRCLPSKTTVNFTDWGWRHATVSYVWETSEIFTGDVSGQWVHLGLRYESGMTEEEELEWDKYAGKMLDEPARLGKYEGEYVRYVVWVWLDKENSAPDSNWEYPEIGTVTLDDPRYSHKGGVWNWKQQYIIWEWRSESGEEYWVDAIQSLHYNPEKDDPNDLWSQYASSSVTCPNRKGKYIGEKVYKTAWVWIES